MARFQGLNRIRQLIPVRCIFLYPISSTLTHLENPPVFTLTSLKGTGRFFCLHPLGRGKQEEKNRIPNLIC
jgi:hypothetical protein